MKPRYCVTAEFLPGHEHIRVSDRGLGRLFHSSEEKRGLRDMAEKLARVHTNSIITVYSPRKGEAPEVYLRTHDGREIRHLGYNKWLGGKN